VNEQEQNRIRQEELFRAQVRLDLERQQTGEKQSGVWIFLNSAFGLFLLSTVAVGVISTSYAYLQEALSARSASRSEIERIEIEIVNRLDTYARTMQKAIEEDALLPLFDAVQHDHGQNGGTFPELLARSSRSLIYELRARTGENVAEFEDALDELDGISAAIGGPGSFGERLSSGELNIDERSSELAVAAIRKLQSIVDSPVNTK
jgi:hypothetical protein